MSRDYAFGIRQIRKFLIDSDINKGGFLDPIIFKEQMKNIGLILVILNY